MAKSMSELEMMELMQEIVESRAAREAWAASLSIPLRKAVAEQSTVRKIFAVDPLPPGAQALYPVEFDDIIAWTVPKVGAVPVNFVEGDDVLVPTFEIASNEQFRMSYARDGRYNINKTAINKLKKAILQTEEETGWNLIKASIKSGHTVTSSEGYFSKAHINAAFAVLESYDFKPDLICCSVKSAADIREWATTELDDTSRREVFKNGGMGSIWGALILPVRRLGDDEAFVFATSEGYGVMPTRQEVTVFDDPTVSNKLRIGLTGWEEVGFAVTDDRACVKITITRT